MQTQTETVNKQTGEVEPSADYVENLRAIEAVITALDTDIADAKAGLKTLREQREQRVDQLRQAVREGKVLPLLEQGADEGDEDDE